MPETFISEDEIFDGGIETQDISASAVTPDKAALSASWFFEGGLTGSLQEASGGLAYLRGEGSVTITTQSNGQVVISGSGGSAGGALPSATGVGQVLFCIDGSTFEVVDPIVGDGWLVNESSGTLLVKG